jgi:hypothetical protein
MLTLDDATNFTLARLIGEIAGVCVFRVRSFSKPPLDSAVKLKSADKRSKLEERGIPAALGGKWSAVQVAVAGGGQPFRGCKRRRRVKK